MPVSYIFYHLNVCARTRCRANARGFAYQSLRLRHGYIFIHTHILHRIRLPSVDAMTGGLSAFAAIAPPCGSVSRTYAHTDTRACTRTHACARTCWHARTHARARTHTDTHTDTDTHTRTHTRACDTATNRLPRARPSRPRRERAGPHPQLLDRATGNAGAAVGVGRRWRRAFTEQRLGHGRLQRRHGRACAASLVQPEEPAACKIFKRVRGGGRFGCCRD